MGGGWGLEDITATAILSFKNGLGTWGNDTSELRTASHKATRGWTDTLGTYSVLVQDVERHRRHETQPKPHEENESSYPVILVR